MPNARLLAAAGVLAAAASGLAAVSAVPPSAAAATTSPIKHVVVIYQENHSFDEVLGALCVQDRRCDGSLTARLLDGSTYPLKKSPDVVPTVNHDTTSARLAIDGGAMDGFEKVKGCSQASGYPCLTYYGPSQIPNLAALARTFTISDRTFQMDIVPSFGAHIELVAAMLDGFTGVSPKSKTGYTSHDGWGCDSNKFASWKNPNGSGSTQSVPACIPDYTDPLPRLTSDRSPSNGGAITSTPVAHVPTIMDRLTAAGISWRLYTSSAVAKVRAYTWSICPVFADCLYTSQADRMVPPTQVITDAQAGSLPAFSVVLPEGPTGGTSQHNGTSMLAGDNWIGQVVGAIEASPQWSSTAVFITYDDCGCFYDHVAPPAGLGIRNPVVIVSPYAKHGATDSTVATTASLLAFTEHTFGLAALGSADANAYDYANAFDFANPPVLTTARMVSSTVPLSSRQYMAAHPVDPHDPT